MTNSMRVTDKDFARGVAMARRIARRWGLRYPDCAEDMESNALYALTLSARRYDPDRECRDLCSFAYIRVLGACKQTLRTRMRKRRGDRVNPKSMSVPPDHLREVEDRDLANFFMGRLPEELAGVVRFRVAGVACREIAERIGVSKTTTVEMYQRAIFLCRSTLETVS